MISTAYAIAEATKEAIFSDEIKHLAVDVLEHRKFMGDEQFQTLLFYLISGVAAKTGDLTAQAILTKDEYQTLVSEINDLENMVSDLE